MPLRRAMAGHQVGGQGRAGQGRAGQGRAGQGRAGQGRAGQGWVAYAGSLVGWCELWCGSSSLVRLFKDRHSSPETLARFIAVAWRVRDRYAKGYPNLKCAPSPVAWPRLLM